MASTLHFCFLFLSVFFFLCPLSSCRVVVPLDKAGVLEKVCRNTSNYDFCFRNLGNDPRASDADLVTLGNISLSEAIFYAKDTYGYISLLLNKAPFDVLLGKCEDRYQSMISYLLYVIKELGKIPPATVQDQLVTVTKYAVSCGDEIKSNGGKSPLAPRHKNMTWFVEILNVIANFLVQ